VVSRLCFYYLAPVQFIADLHIHSHFSIATSQELKPEFLDYWARIKGIQVVGTGDFTHPGWINELREKLQPAEPGLFTLKPDCRMPIPFLSMEQDSEQTRFLLSAEISNIYKKAGKVRKVHNVILAPDFQTVERIQQTLLRYKFNITSDGRPILGMDSRDLLELTLSCSENILFIPAHIWTPWFSALGAQSGFDSIEDCYADLSPFIFAVETGLSSDPPMNWRCSFLDKYTLVSNSDAHSPEKLGRNANIFDTRLEYGSIVQALKTGDSGQCRGTIDFFPQEGKYHYAGHRKCGICWDPDETDRHGGVCTVCHKPVTMGVLNRVNELADRKKGSEKPNRLPFHSLIPLKEILSEIHGTGTETKQIKLAYQNLIQKAGSEFSILLHEPLDNLANYAGSVLVEAIRRMREGKVIIKPGCDGEYGQIRVFEKGEAEMLQQNGSLFGEADTSRQRSEAASRQKSGSAAERSDVPTKVGINSQQSAACPRFVSLAGISSGAKRHPDESRDRQEAGDHDQAKIENRQLAIDNKTGFGLNAEQQEAILHHTGPALVVAGPGTGKTRVLTQRIAFLINHHHIEPGKILGITFTNKAAGEIKERMKTLVNENLCRDLTLCTFHQLGYSILKENVSKTGRECPFSVINEEEKAYLLSTRVNADKKVIPDLSDKITFLKQEVTPISSAREDAGYIRAYQSCLEQNNLFDLDDLIYESVILLRDHPEIADAWRQRYPWILIDEYQDINQAQYELVRLLMQAEEPNLFVIGDPNQAIYGFRGASVKFINRFRSDFPAASIYGLTRSYRCSDQILQASRQVIGNDVGEPPVLYGLRKDVKVKIVSHPTDRSEAEFVARTIEKMMGGLRFYSMDSQISSGEQEEGISSLSDFAVLCRIGRQMDVLEKAFADHSIPCQKVAEDPFFRQKPVRTLLGLLKLAHHPKNQLLGHKLIHEADVIPFHPDQVRQFVQGLSVETALGMLSQSFLKNRPDPDETILKKLLAFARNYGNDHEAFLQFTELGTSADTLEAATEGVRLMTLHASKGLEFKCVFIVGCEEGLLPFSLFEGMESDPEEEKRLIYVGMTRAMKHLYLSHALQRSMMGKVFHPRRSPFLDRIEQNLTEILHSERKRNPQRDQLSLF